MAFRKEGSEVVSRVAVPYDFSDIITKQAQTQALFRQNESREKQFEISKQKSQNNFFKVLFQNKKSRQQLNQVTKGGKFDPSQYHNTNHQNAVNANHPALSNDIVKPSGEPEAALEMLPQGQLTQAQRAAEQKLLVEREMQFLFERGRQEEENAKKLLETQMREGNLEEPPVMKIQRLANMLTDKNRDLEDMDFRAFQAVLDEPGVQKEVSYMLLDQLSKTEHKQNRIGQLTANDKREVIKRCLQCYDKKLFLKLRNGELTVDQVDARISAKHFGVSYKVLDDLRDNLLPEVCNGFVDDCYFKKLYNKGLHEEVPLDEILKPREAWLSNAHCRRSLIGSAGHKSKKDLSIVRLQQYKRQQEQDQRKQKEEQLDQETFHPEKLLAQKAAGRIATKLSRTLSKEQRSFLVTNGDKSEQVENEILAQLDDSEQKSEAVKHIISKLKHKVKTQYWSSLSNSKSEGSLKVTGSSQVQERMQSEQVLYKQLMFLKTLDINIKQQQQDTNEDPSCQIIWNSAHKEMFERIEEESIRSKRLKLGLERNLQTSAEKEEEMKQRKPRPQEIIQEVKMIGKYGTQPYKKRVIDINQQKYQSQLLNDTKQIDDQQNGIQRDLNMKLNASKYVSGMQTLQKLTEWNDQQEFNQMKDDLNQMNNLSASFGIESNNVIEEYKDRNIEEQSKQIDPSYNQKDLNQLKQSQNNSSNNYNLITQQQKESITQNQDRQSLIINDKMSQESILIDKQKQNKSVSVQDKILNDKQTKNKTSLQSIPAEELNSGNGQKEKETRYLNLGSTGNNSELKLQQQNTLYQEEGKKKSLLRINSHENELNLVDIDQLQKIEQNSVEIVIQNYTKNDQNSQKELGTDNANQRKTINQKRINRQLSNEDYIDVYSSTQSITNLKSMEKRQSRLGKEMKNSQQIAPVQRLQLSGSKLIDPKLIPKVNLMNIEPESFAVKKTQMIPEIIKIPYPVINETTPLQDSVILEEDIHGFDNQTFGFQKVKSIQDKSNYKRQMPKSQRQHNQTQKQFGINKLTENFKTTNQESIGFTDVFKTKIDLNELNEETMSYLYSQDQQLFHHSDLKFIKETLGNLDKGVIMTIASTNPTKKMHQNTKTYRSNNLAPSQSANHFYERDINKKDVKDIQKEIDLDQNNIESANQPNLPDKSQTKASKTALTPNIDSLAIGESCAIPEPQILIDTKSMGTVMEKNRGQISINKNAAGKRSTRRGFSAHPSSRSKVDGQIEKFQTMQQSQKQLNKACEVASSRSGHRVNNEKVESNRVWNQMVSKRGSNEDIPLNEYQMNHNKLLEQKQKTQSQMQLHNLKTARLHHNQTAYNWESSRVTGANSREQTTRYSSQLMQLNYRVKVNKFNEGRNNQLQQTYSSTQEASNSVTNEISRANLLQKQLNCPSQTYLHKQSNESLPVSVLQNPQMSINPNLIKKNLRTATQSILKDNAIVNKAFPHRNQGIGPQRQQAINLKKQHQRRIQTSNQVKRETLMYNNVTTGQSQHQFQTQDKSEGQDNSPKREATSVLSKSKTELPQYVNQGTGHSSREHIIDLSQTNTLQKRLNNINSVSDFMSKFEEQDDSPSKISNELAEAPDIGGRQSSFNKTYQGRRATEHLQTMNQEKVRSSIASGGTLNGRNSSSHCHKTQISSARSRIVSATVQLQKPIQNMKIHQKFKEKSYIKKNFQKEHQISRRLVGFLNENRIPVKLTATEEIRFVNHGRVTSQNKTQRSLRSYRKITRAKNERKITTSQKEKLQEKKLDEGIEFSASLGESASKMSNQISNIKVMGNNFSQKPDPKNDMYAIDADVQEYCHYSNQNLKIIDNQFISELVNPNLYLTQTYQEQTQFKERSNQRSIIQHENNEIVQSSVSQLHPSLYTTAVQAASAAQMQKTEESSHTIDSQADQYQTYMSAVNGRFVDSKYKENGKVDSELQNIVDFHEELKIREMQLRLSGLSGNFTRQQHFSDNKRMAAHLSHFRQVDKQKINGQSIGPNPSSFSIQHMNTLAVPEMMEKSQSRNQLQEGKTMSGEHEQEESEVVSKYRAGTRLDDEKKSNSTRKSIVIKSNRTNRNRIQSAVQRGGSDNMRDDLNFKPTSDLENEEGLPQNFPLSQNLFDEIVQEQNRNTNLLSTITKKSDGQNLTSKQVLENGNMDLKFDPNQKIE